MLIYSIISLIMSNAINNRRDSSILYSRISILILINSLFISYNAFFSNYNIKGIILYNGLICIENYTFIFTLFIYIICIIIISINSFFPIKIKNIKFYTNILEIIKTVSVKTVSTKNKVMHMNYMKEQYRILEYPLIILFCIIGAVFLMSSFDIISIFLSIELQSYALYLICSIYRNSESSVSAGLTYFLLGGLSSCIILLGIGLLYINSGTTSLENLYVINNISNIFIYYIQLYYIYDFNVNMDFLIYLSTHDIFINNLSSYISTQYLYIQISLIIMSVGFLFKISSAPFHF